VALTRPPLPPLPPLRADAGEVTFVNATGLSVADVDVVSVDISNVWPVD